MNAGFIEVGGLKTRIDKVVGIYQVWTMGRLPFAQFKVTVVQTPDGDYQATPNVVVRNTETQCNEYVCGLGSSIEEALRGAIHNFQVEVDKQSSNKELDEDDFVWISNS